MGVKKEAGLMVKSIRVRSDSFVDGGLIPKKYTGEGSEISPQLSWDDVDGVKSWVLIADDPDAPEETYVHWVIFDLPRHKTSLQEGISGDKESLGGGIEGVNSSGGPGYIGPYPPSGTHRYYFKVYGLDAPLGLAEGATKEQVLAEMVKHKKIAEGQIMGRYSLQKQ
jgi:Raf kinase inhibitor-like YbhB/YbcL family protein